MLSYLRVINEKTMGDGPAHWAIFEYVFSTLYFLGVVVIKTLCANQSEKEVIKTGCANQYD